MQNIGGAGGGARHTLLDALSHLGDEERLQSLLEHQATIQQRLQTTTKGVEAFNAFSASRYSEHAKTVETYTRLLASTRTDLELVFKRVRSLRAQVERLHPEAHAAVLQEIGARPVLDD